MKEIFRVGDRVELLPYELIANHWGIFPHNWEAVREQNPLTIARIAGDKIFVEGTHYFFKKTAFVRYVEPFLAPVEDLL